MRTATAAFALVLLVALPGLAQPTGGEVVRPGDPLGVPAVCTVNFLFRNATGVFVGAAAHCLGDRSVGDVVTNLKFRDGFATVARRDADLDFALLRLLPGVAYDPAMRDAPGPTRVDDVGARQTGDLLAFHGNGVGVGLPVQTRTRDAVFVGKDATSFWFDTVATPGDSGAPIVARSDGAALGHLVGSALTAHASTDRAVRLDHVLATLAGRGVPLELLPAGT